MWKACAIINPDNQTPVAILLSLGVFFNGWMEVLAISNAIITIDDQRMLGAAGGLAAAVRTAVASVCATVYTTTLKLRLAKTIPANVAPALINAGLPETSVVDFIGALATGEFDNIPGVNTEITAAGIAANKVAYSQAFKTVFLVSLAFSGLAIICAAFSPNTDSRMTNQISAGLSKKDERAVVEKEQS
jgi:hypothetical protein